MIRGSRYIDDLIIFLTYKNLQTKSLAKAIIQTIEQHTYHKFMQLKKEDTSKTFLFLKDSSQLLKIPCKVTPLISNITIKIISH